MRRAALVVLLLALVPMAPASGAGAVHPFQVSVGDEIAHGLLATPSDAPLGLVVIAHGYGHTAESHRAHLQHLADQGYVALAMDFRGSGMPLRAGADDTLAATRWALEQWDLDLVVLYSVSMGTAVSSMVLAESGGLFDLWVNNEGLAMLHETWAGASLLAPTGNGFAVQAKADIEAECQGTPAQTPLCYAERSAALRAPEFAGLRGAVLTHGLNDGLVPYDQGREMAAALRATGVPTDVYTVARSAPGSEGTTLTGHAGQGGQGLAGHGSESNDGHALTALSFRLLDEVLAGTLVPSNAERLVDEP